MGSRSRLGKMATQRNLGQTYQGLFGTAFADAHLLVSSFEVGAELQIFQTSLVRLRSDVISEGKRIKKKKSEKNRVDIQITWLRHYVLFVFNEKFSAPFPQFQWGPADVELFELI